MGSEMCIRDSTRSFWQNIKNFQPQIIHIILRPTISTYAMAKVLKLYCNKAKIIMSALQPPIHYRFIKKFNPLFNPDLILTSCDETERMFTSMNCKVTFLAGGVNTTKFAPVTADIKERLREKYHIDKEKFVVLHVGSIRKNRNLQVFNRIQKQENVQVLIVGNTTFRPDRKEYSSLKEHGCIIWRTYFKNLEEIYRLSDCYVFPSVDKSSCIELPLSVMEAMSCNLPIISTRFGALPRVFDEGDGFIFADKEEDIINELKKIKNGNIKTKTREKVLPYSWGNVAKRLEEIYEGVLKGSI